MQRAIQTERPVLSLKSAFAGETAYSLSRLEAMRSWTPADLAGLAQENTIYAHSSLPVKIKAFTPDERRFVDNLMDASEAIYLSQMRQLVNAADLSRSARHAAFAAIQNVSDQPSTNPINQLNPIMEMSELVLLMYKSDGKMEDWDNRIHAQEEVTLAGAALLAAKARTGAFPTPCPAHSRTRSPASRSATGARGTVASSSSASARTASSTAASRASMSSIPRRHFSATPARRHSLCRRINNSPHRT